ncbi:MAG: hypothetical protein M1140_14165 [Chloroflexi bacterium]|nr:hypothetical protein [Chloroflexota bacterium]
MVRRNLVRFIVIAAFVGATVALLAAMSSPGAVKSANQPAMHYVADSPRIQEARVDAATPLTWTVVLPFVIGSVSPTIQCADAVKNGNFDAPLPGRPWTGEANTTSAVYQDPLISGARAHGGTQSGRVGSPSLNSYWNELLQTVQMPAGVVSATLSYWRFLDTTETSTTIIYDRFTAGLETAQGVEIATPRQIDNTSSGRGIWVHESLDLPYASAYSGQQLWVSFKGATDGTLPSSLYVDDVQLIVCARP